MEVKFSSILALLLIGLKLGGIIKWSWFWVLTPLWFPLSLLLAVLLGLGFLSIAVQLMK